MTPQEIQQFQAAHPIFGHLATPAAKSFRVDIRDGVSKVLAESLQKADAVPAPKQFTDGERITHLGVVFTVVSSDAMLYRIQFPDGTVHEYPKVGFSVENLSRNLLTADPRDFLLQIASTIKPSPAPWEGGRSSIMENRELLAAADQNESLAKTAKRILAALTR